VSEERRREVAAAALAILETEGPDGLTMRAVGDAVGMRAPSLYKHVADKEELTALVIAAVFEDWGTTMREALAALGSRAGRPRRMRALASAYRGWALAHPHLYRLATEGELRRDLLPEGLEAWAAQPIVEAAGGEDVARAAWAFAHGMTILELDRRFPPDADLDAAWSAGIAALGR
jgi:AcrR family transcriptional regulator